MIDAGSFTTESLLEGQRIRRNVVLAALVATVLLVFGTMAAIMWFVPKLSDYMVFIVGATLFLCIAVPVLVFYEPRYGVYILFGSALIFGGDPAKPVYTAPTTLVPMFWNVSSIFQWYAKSHAMDFLVFMPGELLLIVTALAWVVREIVMRRFKVRVGVIALSLFVYGAFVFWGYVNGTVVRPGGDRTIALWEVRAQALLVFSYILGANILRTKEHIRPLFWIMLGCLALEGIEGTITYIAKGGIVTVDGILPHDDSMLLNDLFFLFFITAMTGIDKRMCLLSALASPFALITIMANQRRAGIGAFCIAFIPLLPLIWIGWKERRKYVISFTVVFAIVAAIYLPLTWNATGAFGLPARALRAFTSPDTRDNASNYYRTLEDMDLKFTRDLFPWQGMGYGHPFVQIAPLPKIFYTFKDYIPHDTLLWVWFRLGHFGFLAFLMFVATALIRGIQQVRLVKEPWVRMLGIFAVLQMLQVMVYGKYDLLLINPREMIFLGFMLGMLSVLPKIEAGELTEAVVRPRAVGEIPAEAAAV